MDHEALKKAKEQVVNNPEKAIALALISIAESLASIVGDKKAENEETAGLLEPDTPLSEDELHVILVARQLAGPFYLRSVWRTYNRECSGEDLKEGKVGTLLRNAMRKFVDANEDELPYMKALIDGNMFLSRARAYLRERALPAAFDDIRRNVRRELRKLNLGN